MADSPDATKSLQNTQFFWLYTLAWVGGAIAYVPLLTVLLPARVLSIAGEHAVSWLAYVAFVGAVVASISNILFGWISDIFQNRRLIAAIGLGLSSVLLPVFGIVDQLAWLLALTALWQLSLNMMLAPIAAWAGDCVPDKQKGMLGGFLSMAPAGAAAVGIFITLPDLALSAYRFWILSMIVAVCVLPALLFAKPRRIEELVPQPHAKEPSHSRASYYSDAAARMWIARLLVQITEAALFAYLFLWLQSLSDTISENDTAWTYSLVLFIGIPLAMWAGRWADHRDQPIVPLSASAALVAVGLLLMGLSENLTLALVGYFVFGIAGAVFLALHSAQTLRVLPRPETRGRDLGIFNLSNTIPSIIMPWLTLMLVPVFGFSGLFLLLAALAALAMIALLTMPTRV